MKKTLVLIFAIVLCSALSWGQTPFTKTISVGDGITTYQLTLGFDAAGTYGVDAVLGEREDPVPPPEGVFDARFISARGDTVGFGMGRPLDIRALISNCGLDTFKIRYQSSTEGANTIIVTWPDLTGVGCGYWYLQSSLTASPDFKINMSTQSTYTIASDGTTYGTFFIVKGDGAQYRTFTLNDLALDGYVVKGKKTYSKSIKATDSQVEFCATYVNTETAPVTSLHVEFGTALDSSSLSVTQFPTWSLVKAGKYDKWNFTGASIAVGDSVVICGYGVKAGTKVQKASWYWYTLVNGKIVAQGAKKKTSTFTKNITRLPMPNTVNMGEQVFALSHPKGTPLIVGTVARTDSPKFVSHAKYSDVLKTLVKDAGKVGKQKLQDSLATYLSSFDDKKKGMRMGAAIKKEQKTLPPDKHRNRLLGEALVLSVNLDFSAATPAKTPAGLGALQISSATSLFNGMTVSQVLTAANYFLSYNTYPAIPTATADDFADACAAINGAFTGAMDTTAWSRGQITTTGAKAIAEAGGWLVRPTTFAGENNAALTSGNQPVVYSLQQNYPNPFNPTTNIEFTLANDAYVTVKVFNLLGQEVVTLLNNEEFSAGAQTIEFNAANMPSGVYFYRINVSNNGQEIFQDIKKMVLLK